jgi:RecB family endonuclease NucS
LRIYDDKGVGGAEFSIDAGKGRIDLLAIDSQERFVVVELKLGQGRNRTLGQLLYYMGWVDKHLSQNDPCRGIIIAKDIPEDLILAAQRVPGVSLCRYNLSVSITPIGAPNHTN